MRIVFLTPDIKKKLNGVGLEKIFLNTFLNADFLVIEEEMKRWRETKILEKNKK